MNARERLDRYLDQVRNRLRNVVVARAAAVAAVAVLLGTIIAVWVLNRRGFPSAAVLVARIGLVAILLLVIALLLVRPLYRLYVRRGARELERHLPSQSGRIETYLDSLRRADQRADAPLLELLAEDALVRAEGFPADAVVPSRRAWVPAAVAVAAAGALVLMTGLGSSYWGFGSRLVWLGTPLPEKERVARRIVVHPGNVTVRRNQDLPIRASVHGFDAKDAVVHVRFGEAQKWESAPMRAGSKGAFEFTLYALREPLQYYVTSGGMKSAQYHVAVANPPRIERMRLTYVYPEWTGLPPAVDEASRDIRAVAGTRVEFEIHTNAPLDSPTLVVNGSSLKLQAEGVRATGSLMLKENGQYHVTARVGSQFVPLTDEHDIRLVVDRKPTIEVLRPGRDWHASRIEEVPIRIRAGDDFRVQSVELRYSVNGGEWKSLPLDARAKEVTTETVLRLEELGDSPQATIGEGLLRLRPGATRSVNGTGSQNDADSRNDSGPRLQPGDLISYYVVARDRRQSAQTDLFLIQVQPFDRRYMQSQSAGGQGGGADQPNSISERQREILLATWNLQRSREEPGSRNVARLRDNARMLAELQSTLAQQARTLVTRARARMLAAADEQIRAFVENMELAANAMQPAVKHLGELELQRAIPAEQQALQHLLRAEALFTDIQVAFQNGGSGGGWSAGRDLADMLELEMDLEKNQYETEAPVSTEAPSRQLDEAIRKLRELARRQERLAREAARERALPQEQRWRQEQLRREAEDLRRRLAELARRDAGEKQSGDDQGNPSSQGTQAGGNSASEALRQVENAIRNMSVASGAGSGGEGESPGSRSVAEASRNLRQALEQIESERHEGIVGTFDDFARRARRLLDEQRQSESELRDTVARSGQPGARGSPRYGPLDPERARALAERKRAIQGELQALERDMRAAAQRHREEAPDATRRLGEAVEELARSGTSSRLARSAIDLERGYPLDAATREGLITESLEALERELGQTARVAASEARRRGGPGADESATEELLAELGELRRALQQAQRRGSPGTDGSGARDSRGANDAPRASEGSGASDGLGPAGALQDGHPSHLFEGGSDRLSAWNPPLGEDAFRVPDSPEFRLKAEAISERLQQLMRRMPRGALPSTDVAALRRLAEQLRLGAAGDPMELHYAKMKDAVDQLELAALEATGRARSGAPTRATAPAADSPQYRESVAEYYRRLGAGPD